MGRKAWLGSKLRRLRRKHKLAQTEVARRLEISPSYLNLIEHNQRPLTLPLLLKLAEVFDIDLQAFSEDDEGRLLADLTEMIGDPAFPEHELDKESLKELISLAPEAGRALLLLFRAYRTSMAEAQSLSERLSDDTFLSTSTHELRNLLASIRSFSEILHDNVDMGAGQRRQFYAILVEQSERLSANIDQMLDFAPGDSLKALGAAPNPAEEVSDYLQDLGNYIPTLEENAADLAPPGTTDPASLLVALKDRLAERHGVQVERLAVDAGRSNGLWRFDARRRRLEISELLPSSSVRFVLAWHLGHLACAEIIDGLAKIARMSTPEADHLLRTVLTNYLAGAVILPYAPFLNAARELRYDLGLLESRFGVSFEQVCHRLTTLRRPGDEGVPLHFLRVDIAGNISKRHSASGLRIPRFGGACPRWIVHAAFLTPGQIRTQVDRLPDGSSYFTLARTVVKPSGGAHEPPTCFAVGLGCRVADAPQLVYSDGLDLESTSAVVPIGVTCRLCERPDCRQRAFPPLFKSLSVGGSRGRRREGSTPRKRA